MFTQNHNKTLIHNLLLKYSSWNQTSPRKEKTNENKIVVYKVYADYREFDTLIYTNFQIIKTYFYSQNHDYPWAARPQYPKHIKYSPDPLLSNLKFD